MNSETNEPQSEIAPELEEKLQDIKDRCSPPARISHKTFYTLLLFCSWIPLATHSLITDGLEWDTMRYGHGLLPLNVLMMRNTIIPWLSPAVILMFLLLSFKFKSLRSPTFLAWFALVLLGMTAIYVWLLGMFSFHLLNAS